MEIFYLRTTSSWQLGYNRRRRVQVQGGILIGIFLFMGHIFIATSYRKGGPLVLTARGNPKGGPLACSKGAPLVLTARRGPPLVPTAKGGPPSSYSKKGASLSSYSKGGPLSSYSKGGPPLVLTAMGGGPLVLTARGGGGLSSYSKGAPLSSYKGHLDWKFSIYGAHLHCNLFIIQEDECKCKEAS